MPSIVTKIPPGCGLYLSMSAKRRRTGGNVIRAARRPIDKALIVVSQNTVASSNKVTILQAAAVFPFTLTGLRWSLSIQNTNGASLTQLFWVIVVIPQGTTASNIAISDASTLYSPEQNVLAFGAAFTTAASGAQLITHIGSTKTMRKFKVGDTMEFLSVAEDTNTWSVRGVVQFFKKS